MVPCRCDIRFNNQIEEYFAYFLKHFEITACYWIKHKKQKL